MLTPREKQFNQAGKIYSHLAGIKIKLTNAENYEHILHETAHMLLRDLYQWEKIEFSVEEIERVKRDLKLRLTQILPIVLMEEKLFTKDMLCVLNKPLPKATFWQKIKYCFTVMFQ